MLKQSFLLYHKKSLLREGQLRESEASCSVNHNQSKFKMAILLNIEGVMPPKPAPTSRLG